ncbi:MAG: thiamine ABC transporter substrate-binding protein [Spirochaetes bacterium]|nr:thiamine ABC transporter substrate-binding protein [Spirochaetota bacterium]
MKTKLFQSSFSRVALCTAAALLIASGFCEAAGAGKLVVWTYDSFVSEWGPGAPLAKLYREKGGSEIEFVSKGDGGALLGSLLSMGKLSQVDIVIGLDNLLAGQALASGLFAESRLPNLSKINTSILVDARNRLVPFDYGTFALIWDSQSSVPPPHSLEDLVSPVYAKKLILMDPRTATPGLGFLAWTQAVYGEKWKEYWLRLRPSVLAMTPGWDTGYGLFTRGEAPLVLSYSTSPAYHKAYENNERYKTLVFAQGHVNQIELAGVLADSKNLQQAEEFLDFLLSDEAQALIPETQWMYPANSKATLPPSFAVVPKGIKFLPSHLFDAAKDPEEAVAIFSSAPH